MARAGYLLACVHMHAERQVASSGRRRGRLGGVTDGRARGNAPRRPRTASGESERHYCEPCVTGRNREKGGESMTCGVHM